jgi:hypothetical protein
VQSKVRGRIKANGTPQEARTDVLAPIFDCALR